MKDRKRVVRSRRALMSWGGLKRLQCEDVGLGTAVYAVSGVQDEEKKSGLREIERLTQESILTVLC